MFAPNKESRNKRVGYLERETLDGFLKLPAPQRKIIREVILTFAKVHAHIEAQLGKAQA